jgi:hypothetical protein
MEPFHLVPILECCCRRGRAPGSSPMGALWSRSQAAEGADRSDDSSVRIGPSQGRGRGVFLTRDADAGSVVSCEAPIVAMGTSPQLCASCGRVTGSLAQQLDAQARSLERSSGRAAGPLPACHGLASAPGACSCAGGCGQTYCDDSCRALDAALHALLCPGELGSAGDADFAIQLSQLVQSGSEVSPCLPLAVRAAAWLVATALQPGGSVGAARARLEEATGPLPTGEAGDGQSEGWGGAEEEWAGEEGEGSSRGECSGAECEGEKSEESEGEGSGSAASPSLDGDGGSAHVLMRALYPAVWRCLLSLLLHRLVTSEDLPTGGLSPSGSGGRPHLASPAARAVSNLSALGERWFAALCLAVERRALPVLVPNPLQMQLEVMAAQPHSVGGEWARALGAVACAAVAEMGVKGAAGEGREAGEGVGGGTQADGRGKRRGRAGDAPGVNGSGVNGACVSSGDASRPSKRARAGAVSSTTAHLDRVLFSVSTAGLEVFPALVGMALPAVAAVLYHSCAPNCVVRFGQAGGAGNCGEGGVGGEKGGGGGGGGVGTGLGDASSVVSGWSPCLLVAERRLRRGDELSINYIDASRPVTERRAGLAAVHGFRCECDKCTLEGELDMALAGAAGSGPSGAAGASAAASARRRGGGRRDAASGTCGGKGQRSRGSGGLSSDTPASEALHALASRGLEAGLHAQAAALFRRILASGTDQPQGIFIAQAQGTLLAQPPLIPQDARREGRGGPRDGDAHLGLGGALLRARVAGGGRGVSLA